MECVSSFVGWVASWVVWFARGEARSSVGYPGRSPGRSAASESRFGYHRMKIAARAAIGAW